MLLISRSLASASKSGVSLVVAVQQLNVFFFQLNLAIHPWWHWQVYSNVASFSWWQQTTGFTTPLPAFFPPKDSVVKNSSFISKLWQKIGAKRCICTSYASEQNLKDSAFQFNSLATSLSISLTRQVTVLFKRSPSKTGLLDFVHLNARQELALVLDSWVGGRKRLSR